jgi:hypothetical protein
MSDLQSNILNQYAKAIVEIAREPFLILSADLRGARVAVRVPLSAGNLFGASHE